MKPASNNRRLGDAHPEASRSEHKFAAAASPAATGRRFAHTLLAHAREAAYTSVVLAVMIATTLLPADAAQAHSRQTPGALAARDSGAWVVPAQTPDEEAIFLTLRPVGETETGHASNRMVVNLFQLPPASRHPSYMFAQLTAHVTFSAAGTAVFSFDDRQNGKGVCRIALGAHHIRITLTHTRYGYLGRSVLQGRESFSRSNTGQSFIGTHAKLERLSGSAGATRTAVGPASRYGGDWVWKNEQYRPRILGGLDLTLTFSGSDTAHFSLWQTSPFASQTAHIGANLAFSSQGVAHFKWNDSAWGDRGVGVLRLRGDQIVLTLSRTHGDRAPYGIFPGRYVFV